MSAPNKKKFPGIFVVIAVSFVVYLTVVTAVILFHYQKPKKGNANQNVKISSLDKSLIKKSADRSALEAPEFAKVA